MRRLLAAALLVACSKAAPPSPSTGGGAGDAAPREASVNASVSAADGKALVGQACLSCHTEHMLAQQRLTPVQWTKTVTKMAAWGANLEPTEQAPLVAYLSAKYGPDAGPVTIETITASDAVAELAPTADEPIPAGDAERGKAAFVDRCSGCHGNDARGHIGVLLVERPILWRAGDFARVVRRGQGKMLPMALTDAELGDVLAHLRRLKSPPLPP